MYSNYPEPSTSSTPLPSRQRQSTQRSAVPYSAPLHRIVLPHHRTSSASPLTIQTHFARQNTVQSQQGSQEYSSNPRFSHLLNTVLGSPFLTTADAAQTPSHFNLDGNEVEEQDPRQLRPSSPTPTADYSIIDVEEVDADGLPALRIPGSYPYGHQRSMSSSFAGLSLHSNTGWLSQRSRSCCASPGTGAPFASSNHPTESISMPNMPRSSNPFRTLLPRLWDALSSPSRAIVSGNNKTFSPTPSPTSSNPSNASSPRTFPHSISLPTALFGTQSLSGQSPLLRGGLSKSNHTKGKGKAQRFHESLFNSESAEDIDFVELSPLDGEEGELIDEACFVDVRAITGVDILALLPQELALYILHLVCPPPSCCDSHATRLDPLSNEVEEDSQVALRAILACLAVSRMWRRLADDNSIWRALFLGRWDIDLRRAKLSHMRRLGSVVRFVGTPPRHQQRRHRWNFKHKSQASELSAHAGANANSPHEPSPIIAPVHRVRPASQPSESFPLWFDWRKMYMERLELERRWRGTAYTRLPRLPEALPSSRNTGRCTSNRGAPRSRSLSPVRLLGPTASPSGPVAPNTSVARSGIDRLAETSNRVPSSRTLSSSRTEPAGISAHIHREEKWEPEVTELKGHMDSVYCVEFDSRRIITGSRDRTIKVWSLKTGKLLGSFSGAHRGSVLCLKFEMDWDFAPVCLSLTMCKGRNFNTSTTPSADLELDSDLDSDMECGSDGRMRSKKGPGFMVSGSSDCTICVWKLESGEILGGGGGGGEDDRTRRIEDRDREVRAEPVAMLRGHTRGVLDLRVDRKWIVSSSKDTDIRVWDRKSLRLHRILRGHEGPVNALGLQDGKVVSASGDGKVILWDIESGKRLKTLDGHDRGLACIEFKGNLIVSGSSDCQIRLWNALTGECLRTFSGHSALVRALSFDPRTGWLVSASYDRVVKIWDLRTGKLIREFKRAHAGQIFDVKFNVGRLVSSSHDRRVCVFDFTAGLDASVFV